MKVPVRDQFRPQHSCLDADTPDAQQTARRLLHFHLVFLKPFADEDVVMVFGCPAHERQHSEMAVSVENVIECLRKYMVAITRSFVQSLHHTISQGFQQFCNLS